MAIIIPCVHHLMPSPHCLVFPNIVDYCDGQRVVRGTAEAAALRGYGFRHMEMRDVR
jgi:hypothetical protein